MSYTISPSHCKEWEKKKDINPITGRKIKEGGPVYKRFEKRCQQKNESSKKEVVFDGFKNSTIKKEFEKEDMKIKASIGDATVLVIVKDLQILLDNEDPIINNAQKRKIPLTTMETVETFITYNKHTNIPGFIEYLRDEQYGSHNEKMKKMNELADRLEKMLLKKN